jgi:hypothetical protein
LATLMQFCLRPCKASSSSGRTERFCHDQFQMLCKAANWRPNLFDKEMMWWHPTNRYKIPTPPHGLFLNDFEYIFFWSSYWPLLDLPWWYRIIRMMLCRHLAADATVVIMTDATTVFFTYQTKP